MPEYVYLLRPSFDAPFLERATQEQRAVFEDHGAYLERLHAEGVLLFAGRCYPGPLAVVVIQTGDEEAARRVMDEDPSVRAGVQAVELHPFRVFLAREHGS
jgi:uncharacterized protein YciI